MTVPPTYDVAIVGFGPVGAALANALGARGLRVGVVEREAEVFELPRAVHFDAEVMRVFQSLGLADAVLACTIPTRGIEFVDSSGDRYFGTVERGSRPTPTELGWERGYMFTQPQLERALRGGLERFGCVDVFLQHEVEAIEGPLDAAPCLRVRDLRSGGQRELHAEWIVGCDGASSPTRRLLDGKLESLGYDRQWLVVDVFLRREVELPQMSQQICDPKRPTTFIYSARNHRRWEFQLRPDETRQEMERPESIRRLLSRWLRPEDVEIVRSSVYEFHGVVTGPWRRGRVLIAGDAAHQMPPFQGQGMCAGIRDVANLEWKLAMVLRGDAPESLLDTYEAERAPHVRAVVASSIGVGRLIERLARAEAEGEVFRDAMLEAHATRRPGWMPRLTCGLMPPASEDDDGPIGDLLVQPRVRWRGAAMLLDDAVGPRFAVILPASGDWLDPERQELLRRIDAQVLRMGELEDLDGWLEALVAAHGALLVRPDRYVLGVSRETGTFRDLLDGLHDALAP